MAAKKDKSLVVKFEEEKTTTNTVRYQSGDPKDENVEIPFVYIKKSGVKKLGSPKKIKVTVEVDS